MARYVYASGNRGVLDSLKSSRGPKGDILTLGQRHLNGAFRVVKLRFVCFSEAGTELSVETGKGYEDKGAARKRMQRVYS